MPNSKKQQLVSLTQIRKELKGMTFNPRTPGPMKIIAEQGSPEYYECRAMEEIAHAQYCRQSIGTDPSGLDDYRDHLITAVRLLILAKLSV